MNGPRWVDVDVGGIRGLRTVVVNLMACMVQIVECMEVAGMQQRMVGDL